MDRDLLEAAYSLETASTLDRAWKICASALAMRGADKVMYITRSDEVIADWFVLSTLPDQWPSDATCDPEFSEPFVTYCCATFEPTKLGQSFFEMHSGYLDDYTRRYVDKMAGFDWTIGIGFPCCLKGSGRHGGLILGNNMDLHTFERAILPAKEQLQSFALIAHRKFDELRRGAERDQQRRPLSAREHQVLELLSQGLRPQAIATQLGVSVPSVRLYLKNARLKLGAATKEEALVRFQEAGAAKHSASS